MINKYLKMVAAAVLAVSVAASVTACGSNSNSTSGETKKGDTADVSALVDESKPVITVMAPAYYGTELKNENSDQVIEKYQDYTQTQVKWQFEADDTYDEKFGLTLMDKDNMPMILTAKGEMSANVVDAARKGAFWDLTPYLSDEEKYPNLSKANEQVLDALKVDGQIVGIYRARAIGRNGLSYRTDWAEAVGITEEPKTIEDVYNMMYQFTYGDPDGNGVDDTYGLEMTKYVGPLDIIQTWFGCGNEWVEQDGKLIPVHQTKEYMEALKWMRKMYEEGLIRQDWATVDTGTFSDALKKGEAGVYIDVMDSGKRIWNYYIQNDVKSVVDPSKTASINMVGPINGKTLATSGFNGYFLITKSGAKTEEDLEHCLKFLDQMCDDEMLVLADYGLEGLTYDFSEEGEVVMKRDLELQQTPQVGLNQVICYIPNTASTDPVIQKEESLLKQEEAQVRNEAVAVFNPALGYLANSLVNAEVGTDIELIIDDARTQYICGQIDEKGIEDAAKQWLDRGGDRLIEDINELYQQEEK